MRKSPGCIVLVAVLLRMVMILIVGDAPALIDMQEYHDLAVSVLEGRGYANSDGPTAFRPPAYPFFLTSVYALVGSPSIIYARLVQALLGGLEVWLTWYAASLLFGAGIGISAAWIVAIYPTRLIYVTFLHRETLAGVLWLWQLIAFLRLRNSQRSAERIFVTGLSIAVSALCNAVYLATSVALSTIYLFSREESEMNRFLGRLGTIVAIWIVAMGALAPWGMRNNAVLGDWVWINTKGGNALWEGNNPGWLQGLSEMEIRKGQWDTMEGMSEIEADGYARTQGLAFIRKHPDQFLYLTWRRALQFWRLELLPFFYYKQGFFGVLPKGVLLFLAPLFLAPFPLLMAGAIRGVFSGWKSTSVRILVILAATHCLASSIFIGGFRYHYPLIPMLSYLAVLGWKQRKQLTTSMRVLWLTVVALFFLNFADHVAANWTQIRAMMGKGGRYEHSDTRSWMKKGLF